MNRNPEDRRRRRICVVGAGLHFLSGVSYYTLREVNSLAGDHEASVILMRRLLPTYLYPGREHVGARLTNQAYAPSVRVFNGVDWYWLPSMARALVFLARVRPEVVILQWWSGSVLHSYLLLAAAARLLGARIVIEFHEVLDTGEARIGWVNWYVRLVLPLLMRLASGFVMHSEYDRAELNRLYRLGRLPCVVAPLGPFDQYRLASGSRVARAAPPECFNLLYFGVIRPFKGVEDLVRAFERIPETEIDQYWLTVVGETWEGWDLPVDLIAHSRYHDRITLINRYVSDEEVAAVFAGADAVVLPYHRSSGSGPLHIAMSQGLPVVVTQVGGLSEAVSGYAGAVLVPPNDPETLHLALREIRKRQGLRFADQHSWESTTQHLDELFALLDGGKSTPTTADSVPKPTQGAMMNVEAATVRANGDVSVVICTYTDERWALLKDAVESVRRQTPLTPEIIVVVDHNPALLLRARMDLPGAVVVENTEEPGLSGARNSGIAVARGQVVAFLDDDAAAETDWLARLTSAYDNPVVLGVGGHLEPAWDTERPAWLPPEYNWVIGCSYIGLPQATAPVRNIIGANMSVRRDVLEGLGGFRRGFGKRGLRSEPEDTDLCIRGSQSWPRRVWLHEPAAVVRHRVPASRANWRYFTWRCFLEGIGKAKLARGVGLFYGLAAERTYVLRTLPAGIVRGLREALRGDVMGLVRSAAMVAGLGITVAGFVAGVFGVGAGRTATARSQRELAA
jgi:glycosyltransferase involved in cell wall biosynthesis